MYALGFKVYTDFFKLFSNELIFDTQITSEDVLAYYLEFKC